MKTNRFKMLESKSEKQLIELRDKRRKEVFDKIEEKRKKELEVKNKLIGEILFLESQLDGFKL